MLDILKKLIIHDKLNDPNNWKSLNIDYEYPNVERLWMSIEDKRIYLHKIYNCSNSKPLFHKHPWPCAVRLCEGSYEMGIGYGEVTLEPPIASKVILVAGTCYEMLHPLGWHYIRPLTEECYSIMVTGRPYVESMHAEKPELLPLKDSIKSQLLIKFQNILTKHM